MSLAPACVYEHGMWLFLEPGVHLLDPREDRAVPKHAGTVAHRLEVTVRVDHLRDKFSRACRDMPVGPRPSAVPQVPVISRWRGRRRDEVGPLAFSRFRVAAHAHERLIRSPTVALSHALRAGWRVVGQRRGNASWASASPLVEPAVEVADPEKQARPVAAVGDARRGAARQRVEAPRLAGQVLGRPLRVDPRLGPGGQGLRGDCRCPPRYLLD
jgi:hypothetical protein